MFFHHGPDFFVVPETDQAFSNIFKRSDKRSFSRYNVASVYNYLTSRDQILNNDIFFSHLAQGNSSENQHFCLALTA